MPNLEHDPRNPTDLLDQPIQAGDRVAWGTTYGRSAALCVATIDRIRFTRKEDSWGKNIECTQPEADDYQLVLRPEKSTGGITWLKAGTKEEWRPWVDGKAKPGQVEAKLKIIQHVKNVVKLP